MLTEDVMDKLSLDQYYDYKICSAITIEHVNVDLTLKNWFNCAKISLLLESAG